MKFEKAIYAGTGACLGLIFGLCVWFIHVFVDANIAIMAFFIALIYSLYILWNSWEHQPDVLEGNNK